MACGILKRLCTSPLPFPSLPLQKKTTPGIAKKHKPLISDGLSYPCLTKNGTCSELSIVGDGLKGKQSAIP